MKPNNPDIWQCLGLGHGIPDSQPSVSFITRLRMIAAYARAVLVFKKTGFVGIRTELENKRRQETSKDLEPIIWLARRQLPLLRTVGRVLGEDMLCLSSSFSLTCGLLSIDIPAYLVIGKGRHFLSEKFDLHAWVEIGGIPVFESPQVQNRFKSIIELPKRG